MINELLKFKSRARRIDEELKSFQSDIHDVAINLAEELNRLYQREYQIEVIAEPDEDYASFSTFDFYIEKDGVRRHVTCFSLDEFKSSTIENVLEILDEGYNLRFKKSY